MEKLKLAKMIIMTLSELKLYGCILYKFNIIDKVTLII